jgi:hypothetical protein
MARSRCSRCAKPALKEEPPLGAAPGDEIGGSGIGRPWLHNPYIDETPNLFRPWGRMSETRAEENPFYGACRETLPCANIVINLGGVARGCAGW